jgi:tripartite-type tricarboxylate transporter receptor subunit TctC
MTSAGGRLQIDLMVENLVTTLPQVREGDIKAFAVATKTRSVAAPEIPTVDDAGLPGFYVTGNWIGVWARKARLRMR